MVALVSGGQLTSGWSTESIYPGVDVIDYTTDLALDPHQFGPAWKNQPSVRKVTGFIARHIASTPLHLFDRLGDQNRPRVTDGPLADLLRKPSRAQEITAFVFWQAFWIDRLINDKAVALIKQHDDGFELIRIPARRVKFTNDGFDRIKKVRILLDGGKTVERDPKDFLISVGYSADGVNGTSPMDTLQHILDEQREAVAYRRSVWKSGARVPGFITRPAGAEWTDAARARFERGWRAFSKGGGKEGGTPILQDGMTYTQATAFRPRDTNDLEGRRLTDIEVASAFYVAPELVGAREGTFANIRAFKQMLYGPSLGPYISEWEQAVDGTLTPRLAPGTKQYVEANVEAKLRGSFEEQADMLSSAIGGPWMSRNEGRGRMNLSAIDGGDELITPLNVLVGGQSSPQDGKAAAALQQWHEGLQKRIGQREDGDAWWKSAPRPLQSISDALTAAEDLFDDQYSDPAPGAER